MSTASRHGGSYNQSELLASTVVSANDICAAGQAGFKPLFEHWDGTSWTASTALGGQGELTLVHCIVIIPIVLPRSYTWKH